MVARQPPKTLSKPPPWKDKKKPKCTHCGYLNHTADLCFQLIGYPSGWKGPRLSRKLVDTPAVHAVTTSKPADDGGPSNSFNHDLYQQFIAFTKTQQTPTHNHTAATITAGSVQHEDDWFC
ncbi:uncharacterized protein LOC111380333 [Olea europaea var. sylvestris]|uniref:Uncharacterized protein n=1 Tax=Olea europaea subsp. europaea TaxID=158383 RepID=A0A8S0TPH2_OLEEU|nr:uncharacterized protein LOC111380333 [Olea europaea var. sylvestris]CAA3007918.1 Hypothetical predicted protein [Olea europaea subsp. europaea]